MSASQTKVENTNYYFTSEKIDPRVREYKTPVRVVWQEESVTGAEAMLKPVDPQINFFVPELMKLSTQGGNKSAVLLDFGVEFHGYVKLFIRDVSSKENNRVKIRVRFGESAMEAMADIGGEKNATNDHIDRDQILDVGFLSMPEIGPSGFRFVRIDLLSEDASITFKGVTGIFTYRPLEYKGSFKCSDDKLNKIFDTCAYTAHLCMQEYVWDGIKRDRLIWIGDMHPMVDTIKAVFGYDEVVEKSLDLVRNETPQTTFPMCSLTVYTLWWILIQYNWYYQNGRLEYLCEQHDFMKKLATYLMSVVDEQGVEHVPERRLLDWPTSENPDGEHAGIQSLMVMSFKAVAEMFGEMAKAKPELKSEDAEFIKELDAKRELMLTHVPNPNGSKQAAALMILSGLATGDKVKDLIENVIMKDGAHRISTFLGKYALEALVHEGRADVALDICKEFWGAMLDRGATTFWEDFNLDWLEGSGRIDELVPEGVKDLHGDYGAYCYKGFRHSLCHGWSSGPAAFMLNNILGIVPTKPGCKEVTIKPSLGNLDWAEGTYPTPNGVISVRAEKCASGKLSVKVKAPRGVKVKVIK